MLSKTNRSQLKSQMNAVSNERVTSQQITNEPSYMNGFQLTKSKIKWSQMKWSQLSAHRKFYPYVTRVAKMQLASVTIRTCMQLFELS